MQVYHISVCFCLLSTTYCSPAFWPRSQSGGSVGSAGPQEEEVEEPQTLEPQQSGRRSSRETESNGGVWTGRKTEDRKKSKRASQRRENPNWACCKRKRGGETTKSLWASKNSTESIAEQLDWKLPISVLLCCVFQAGPNRPSSNLSLRIYLISICFKNQTQKLQRFQRGERSAKHDADPETWQLQLQDNASGRQIRLLKEFAGISLEQYFWMQFSILAHLHPSLKKPVPT